MSMQNLKRMLSFMLCLCMLLACIPAAQAATLAISRQPANVAVAAGKTASTSVAATGEGLTYRWYYKDAGSSVYSASSATSSTYSLVMKAAYNGRRVYCRVTDKYGNTVNSNSALLSVATPLKITRQPAGVTVASGKTATVSVAATGDGLTYRWYYKDAGSSSYAKSSVTTSTYSLGMKAAYNGRRVYCRVTDKYGNTVNSNSALLSMAASAKITRQPANVTTTAGKTAKVSVAATGDGLTYRWYYKDAGSSVYSKSSVATSTYSLVMKAAYNGRRVYCRVTDKYGNVVNSTSALLTLAAPAKITRHPANMTVASGKTAKVSVGATGDGLTYRWYYKDAGSSVYSMSSVTTASYSLLMNAARDGRRVYCRVTDKYGNVVNSNSALLTMEAVKTNYTLSVKHAGKTISTDNPYPVWNDSAKMNWTISCDGEWQAKTADTWFTVEKTSDTNLRFQLKSGYTGSSYREGIVTITAGTQEWLYVIRQENPVLEILHGQDVLFDSTEDIEGYGEMGAGAGSGDKYTLTVSSTHPWTLETDADWFDIDVTSSNGTTAGEKVVLTMNDNISGDEHTGTLTFTFGSYMSYSTVLVKPDDGSDDTQYLQKQQAIVSRAKAYMFSGSNKYYAEGIPYYAASGSKVIAAGWYLHGVPYSLQNGPTYCRNTLDKYLALSLEEKCERSTYSTSGGTRTGATYGLDCTGFCLDCWNRAAPYSMNGGFSATVKSTAYMLSVTGSSSFKQAQPGDVLRTSGHVMLVIENNPSSSKLVVIEQTASQGAVVSCECSGCVSNEVSTLGTRMKTYSYSALSSYTEIYRQENCMSSAYTDGWNAPGTY